MAHSDRSLGGPSASPTQLTSLPSTTMSTSTSTADREQHLLGIFAGARGSSRKNTSSNEWVVVKQASQRPPRLKPSIPSSSTMASITPDRSGFATRPTVAGPSTLNPNRLSRIVDAVVEDPNHPEYSYQGALLQRTLRPRGLSDSSIHSTYVSDGMAAQQVQRLVTPAGLALGVTPIDALSDSTGAGGSEAGESGGGLAYLENLGKRMHGYTTSLGGKSTPPLSPKIGTLPNSANLIRTSSRRDRTTSAGTREPTASTSVRERAGSAGSKVLPPPAHIRAAGATPNTPSRLDGFKSVLPAWVASAEANTDQMMQGGPGSYREESIMARTLGRGRDM